MDKLNIKIQRTDRNINRIVLNNLDITPYLQKSEIVNGEGAGTQQLILTISLDKDKTNLNVSL